MKLNKWQRLTIEIRISYSRNANLYKEQHRVNLGVSKIHIFAEK